MLPEDELQNDLRTLQISLEQRFGEALTHEAERMLAELCRLSGLAVAEVLRVAGTDELRHARRESHN